MSIKADTIVNSLVNTIFDFLAKQFPVYIFMLLSCFSLTTCISPLLLSSNVFIFIAIILIFILILSLPISLEKDNCRSAPLLWLHLYFSAIQQHVNSTEHYKT